LKLDVVISRKKSGRGSEELANLEVLDESFASIDLADNFVRISPEGTCHLQKFNDVKSPLSAFVGGNETLWPAHDFGDVLLSHSRPPTGLEQ
jgi:hypothetical protein